MKTKFVIAIDRGDLEWQQSITDKPAVDEKKIKTILDNLKFRIIQEANKLSDSRKFMKEDAIKRATAFINGLKHRFNQLFEKIHGNKYYAVAGSTKMKKSAKPKRINVLFNDSK